MHGWAQFLETDFLIETNLSIFGSSYENERILSHSGIFGIGFL